MKLSLVALLAVLGASASGVAHAQEPYGSRAVTRFIQRVRVDTNLPDSLRTLTPGRLDSLSLMYFSLLDDTGAAMYMRAMAAALTQLPESLCAHLLDPSADNTLSLPTILDHVDSATVDTLLLVHWLALHATNSPHALPIAAPAELQEGMFKMVTALSLEDRQRFAYIAQHPPPTPADACWASRTLFTGLSHLPPEELGPLQRRMTARPGARP